MAKQLVFLPGEGYERIRGNVWVIDKIKILIK